MIVAVEQLGIAVGIVAVVVDVAAGIESLDNHHQRSRTHNHVVAVAVRAVHRRC